LEEYIDTRPFLSLSLSLSQKENWRKRKNLSTPFPKEKEVEGRKSKETFTCYKRKGRLEGKKNMFMHSKGEEGGSEKKTSI
jgi:hypothetical protein